MVKSSPDKSAKSEPQPRLTSVAFAMSPVASLRAVMFAIVESSATVEGAILMTDRPGTSYKQISTSTASAMALKCSSNPAWGGLL